MNELTKHTHMPLASVTDMREMAEEVAKSGLLPNIRTPAAAFVVAQHVIAKNMTFVEFLSRYHVTGQGTVSVKADVQLADMMQSGFKIKWIRFDNEEARATFFDQDKYATELAFSIEDAKQAGLLDSKNDNWHKRPAAMLRARLVSMAKRMLCPGETAGLYNESETDEIDADRMKRAEPAKADPVKAEKAVKAVKEVKKAAPAVEIEDAVEVAIPNPFDKKPAAAPAENDPTVCPIKGKMFGKPWAGMTAEVLDYALSLSDGAMTDAHRDCIRETLAQIGGEA